MTRAFSRQALGRRLAALAESVVADGLMGSALAGFFVSILTGGLLWGLPAESVVKQPLTYTHSVSWHYSADPDYDPVQLSGGGILVPDPSVLDEPLTTGQPLFIRTHPRVNFLAEYEFGAPSALGITGETTLIAVLSHPSTGWRTEVVLVPSTAFEGDTVRVEAFVDLRDWVRTFESVAAVAGGPSVFSATLRLDGVLQAELEGQLLAERFSSALPFRVEVPTVARIDPSADVPSGPSGATSDPFTQVESRSIIVQRVSESRISLLFWDFSVRQLRPLTVIGAVMALGTMVTLHLMRTLANRRGRLFQIMARYEREIFDAPADMYIEFSPIAVPIESWEDLLDIARLRRRPILRIVYGGSVYFIVSDRPNAVFMLEMRGPDVSSEIADAERHE